MALIDPLKAKALKEAQEAKGERPISEIAIRAKRQVERDLKTVNATAAKVLTNPTTFETKGPYPAEMKLPGVSLEAMIRKDFRVLLTLIWRHLLGNDPNPIQLDMAWWLQHGGDRTIIMAFRGFSKSWITGSYAIWALYCDPNEKVMVVSGSLPRAQATSSWALSVIMSMDILAHMRPNTNNRSSATMWDVGNCIPQQSASFTAFGIGGQMVGFRGSLIIPDDVETQTNSLTSVMREKVREAVKEFESILVPGGRIKYLGTPHDSESLYLYLLSLKNEDGSQVYEARVWTALFPTEEEIASYKGRIAPYLLSEIKRLGPSCIGHSTMPMRFTDEDLSKRKAAMGNSEFRLQFMLDMSAMSQDRYPLKLRDLIVMDLDDKKAPEDVAWGTTHRWEDLPIMGFDGDYYHGPVHVGDHYAPYERVHAFIDPSGRGSNQTALLIGGLLMGRCFLLRKWATRDGYGPKTLQAIADAMVRFKVHKLTIEGNFGDGMFLALVTPVIRKAWEEWNDLHPKEQGGTIVEELRSGVQAKEKRILSVLEPVTQAHRLVVAREVVLEDQRQVQRIEGEDGRKYYSLWYQYTHLTGENGSLGEDDCVEGLAGLLATFGIALGVDPLGMALRARKERDDDLEAWLMSQEDEATGRASTGRRDQRIVAARPQKR